MDWTGTCFEWEIEPKSSNACHQGALCWSRDHEKDGKSQNTSFRFFDGSTFDARLMVKWITRKSCTGGDWKPQHKIWTRTKGNTFRTSQVSAEHWRAKLRLLPARMSVSNCPSSNIPTLKTKQKPFYYAYLPPCNSCCCAFMLSISSLEVGPKPMKEGVED